MKNKVSRIFKQIGEFWQDKLRTILTVISVFIGAFTIALTSVVNFGVTTILTNRSVFLATIVQF